MKFFYAAMLVFAVLGTIWTVSVKGADGSPLAIVVPVTLGGGVAYYKKRRTGSIFSNSAAGR